MPLKNKRTKSGFRRLANLSICPKTVLTKESIQKCARKQRLYILAYLGLDHANENNTNNENNTEINTQNNTQNQNPNDFNAPEMSCSLIEKLVKTYKKPHKTHRCTLDQEKKFINGVVSWMKSVNTKH